MQKLSAGVYESCWTEFVAKQTQDWTLPCFVLIFSHFNRKHLNDQDSYRSGSLTQFPCQGVSRFERENRKQQWGSENQTETNELAQMGMEPMAFGLALRRSNHVLSLIFTASWVPAIL